MMFCSSVCRFRPESKECKQERENEQNIKKRSRNELRDLDVFVVHKKGK